MGYRAGEFDWKPRHALGARVSAIVVQARNPSCGTDVFLVAGQSNASGVSGNADDSPQVQTGEVLQFWKERIYDANDPVGNALPGSAWPAFGSTYHRLTGHRVLLVPAAVPASALTGQADAFQVGHWGRYGLLYGDALAKLRSALVAVGPHASFKGVLWSQGEAEAGSSASDYAAASNYERDLLDLIDRFRADLGARTPFFIFQTGTTDHPHAVGYQKVRAAQDAVSRRVRAAPIVFAGAASFLARGMMNQGGPHYSQAGYNEMGVEGARAVAAFLSRSEHNGSSGRAHLTIAVSDFLKRTWRLIFGLNGKSV